MTSAAMIPDNNCSVATSSGGKSTSMSKGKKSDRVSIVKIKSNKALLLSSKVRNIKNLVAPYQLGDADSLSDDDDDDLSDDDADSLVDDIDDIDESARDVFVEDDDDDENESGSVTETRKQSSSPSSPASVIVSDDSVFSSEKGDVASADNSSTGSKSKSSKREPSNRKSREPLSDASSHQKREVAAAAPYLRMFTPPQRAGDGAIPSDGDLGYGELSCPPKTRTCRRGSTGRLAAPIVKDKLGGKSEHQIRIRRVGSDKANKRPRRPSTGRLVTEETEATSVGLASKESDSAHKKRELAAAAPYQRKVTPVSIPSHEALGYGDFKSPAKIRARRRGSTGKLSAATVHDGFSKSEHQKREITAATDFLTMFAPPHRTGDGLIPSREDLGYGEFSSPPKTRASRRGSTGRLAVPTVKDKLGGKSEHQIRVRRVESEKNKKIERSLEGRKPRRRSTGRLVTEETEAALTEPASKQDETAKGEGKYRRSSRISREEKSKASSRVEQSSLPKKPKRRESTGSLFDDSAEQAKLKNVPSRRPKRVSKRGVMLEGNISLEMEDKQTKRDLTSKSKKLVLRGSSEGKLNSNDHSTGKSDKRLSKGQRLRHAKSFDDESCSIAPSIDKSADDSKDAPDRRDKRRSKYVNQRNLKVGHIDRRSRRNLMKDVGPNNKSLRSLNIQASTTSGMQASTTSGSMSDLTQSTGFQSKDDTTLSSSSENVKRASSASDVYNGSGQQGIVRSRWEALPQAEQHSISDDTPVRPAQDLSSVCSPGRAFAKTTVLAASAEAEHANEQIAYSLSLSSSGVISQLTTPSARSKRSISLSTVGKTLQTLQSDERDKNMGSRSSLYPEILIPATPCRSAAGCVSELSNSNPDLMLTPMPATRKLRSGSLHSKLQLLPPVTPATVQSAPYAGVTPHATATKALGGSWRQQFPETPGVSIAVGQLDTPGGMVSELTNATFLGRGDCTRRVSTLSAFMTETQTTLLHEGEYSQDQIPRMVRRHSLDSVSILPENNVDSGSNGQHKKSLLDDSKSRTSSGLPSLLNDNTPRVPARQMSLASTVYSNY